MWYNNYVPNESIRPKKIIDKEIKWEKRKTIVSTTDKKGIILYANDTFSKTCEYSKMELLGEHHSIIRHPDMPKVAFKALWDSLNKGKNFHAIVKNLTKSGYYYWVITDFTINKNNEGDITGYTAKRKAVPQGVVDKIAPIYKAILEVEKSKGEKAAELFFESYLKENVGKSYEEFILDLFDEELKKEEKRNTNFFGRLTSFKRSLKWFFGKDEN